MNEQSNITQGGTIECAIRRFAETGLVPPDVVPRPISRAILEDGPRKIVLLDGARGTYAFKHNPAAAKSGEFAKEAKRLARLGGYLQATPAFGVVEVVWVDPEGEAMATRFDPSPTARDALATAQTEEARREVFARGGRWLSAAEIWKRFRICRRPRQATPGVAGSSIATARLQSSRYIWHGSDSG